MMMIKELTVPVVINRDATILGKLLSRYSTLRTDSIRLKERRACSCRWWQISRWAGGHTICKSRTIGKPSRNVSKTHLLLKTSLLTYSLACILHAHQNPNQNKCCVLSLRQHV